MPRIASVTAKQLTVGDPFQTKERVVARLGSLAAATYSLSLELDPLNSNTQGFGSRVSFIKVQPDLKIICAGEFTSYDGSSARQYLLRLNPDGSLDTGFAAHIFNNLVTQTALQSDGKIVAVGGFTALNGQTHNRIVRLNADGTVDDTFVTGTGFNQVVYAVAVDANDKILVGGVFTQYNGQTHNRIVRLNTDGSVDGTFVTGTGFDNSVLHINLQADNKILVLGGFENYDSTGRNRVARLNTDGTIDAGFTPTGINVATDPTNSAIQADGKIVIVGSFTTFNGVTRLRVTRLNTDGSTDTGFNSGGTGFNGFVGAVALQQDGKILLGTAGSTDTYNGVGFTGRMIRLNTDGSVDDSFSVSNTDVNESVNGFAFLGSNILACGSFTRSGSNGFQRLVRLTSTGTPVIYTTAVDEGAEYSFSVNTANIRNGTVLRWRILDRPTDFSASTGTLTITSNAGSFTVTPTEDLLLEGSETFRVQLEKLSGTVMATSAAITINDTSATILTITPDETTVDEGDTVTFTVNLVSGTYPSGTPLYWTASSSQDFTVASGSFTLSGGTATFSAILKLDLTEEGTETVTVSLRSTSIEGIVLVTSDPIIVNDTSVPTYVITPAALNVDEGSSLNVTVNTTGISDGTTLYWTASSADISPQDGSFIVNSNTGSFAVTPSRDATTEGSETFTISVRTGSIGGTIRATTGSITINDTSLDPTYTVTPAQNLVNEGSSLTLNVSTTDVFDDTTLYWTVTNSGDFGTSSGSFSISNNTGSFSVTPTADLTTEGSETFTVSIRTGSISGNIVATSSSVTIVDTSTTPTFEYLLIAGGGGGGSGGENGGPGGGGAGGYRTGFGTLTTGINYTVSIGGGGSISARGGDSYISGSPLTESPSGAGTNTIKSYGGGFGGRDASGAQAGASGGSGGGGGGGGWGGSYAGGAGNTPETDPSQGNNGGSSNFFGASDNGAGGGGGGAGDIGSNASGNNGGNGGAGAVSSITGTEVTRAGGGGGRPRGGSAGTGGIGGAGGGGNAGSPGATNTGGGGGGGNVGGSGVIILKYPNTYTISNPGGGLTLATDTTSVAGFKITTITVGTGNIQFA